MKGIILAGGSGSRLSPLTLVTSKQLLPVYNKPMIYYPLSTLMQAGIRDILIISTPHDLPNFKKLLGDGSSFGITLSYKEQPNPGGIAQAFIIAEDFINDEPCALILGDNIFFGRCFMGLLTEALLNARLCNKSTVFGYKTKHPERYGVIEFEKSDFSNKIISIEEKPSNPKSDYCVTGFYVYSSKVVEYAKQLKPSNRGELEITDLNNLYIKDGTLRVTLLKDGSVWYDVGSIDTLTEASEFIREFITERDMEIGVPEGIAYKYKWITKESLLASVEKHKNSPYGEYLQRLADGEGYVIW